MDSRGRIGRCDAGWLRYGFDSCHGGPVARVRLISAFDQDHFFVVVDLPELDLDNFPGCGLHMASDKTGLDGRLAMATVNQHQQLYSPRAAVVKESVQGSADGSAGVENIVDQNNVAAGDIKADGAGNYDRPNITGGKVVAVEVDVENAGIDGRLLDGADEVTQALRQGYPRRLMPTSPRIGPPLFLTMMWGGSRISVCWIR